MPTIQSRYTDQKNPKKNKKKKTNYFARNYVFGQNYPYSNTKIYRAGKGKLRIIEKLAIIKIGSKK